MVDKRSLRSNKPDSEPSTNGDHSTTSSSKSHANAKSAPTKATSAYYANCDAARAAGAAPVRVGDPGYSSKLDRDGDGVGCE